MSKKPTKIATPYSESPGRDDPRSFLFFAVADYIASTAALKTPGGLNFTAWRFGRIFVVPVPLMLFNTFRGGPGKLLDHPEPVQGHPGGPHN
jgi:hypothetical protein